MPHMRADDFSNSRHTPGTMSGTEVRDMPAPGTRAPISVIGAGVAGTWQALAFARAGFSVGLYERGDATLAQSTGYWAGGMLAPYCEGETAEYLITRLGLRSLDLWRQTLSDAVFNGSLVVAHPRDRADIARFDRLAGPHRRVDSGEIAELEPMLAGRFPDGLYFENEGHVDPRRALPALHEVLRGAGVPIEFNAAAAPEDFEGTVIDCRGIAARDTCPDLNLRGVKGEVVIVETHEIALSRPIRLVHPRWSLYIVPREGGRFFIGATSIESEDRGMSVRSALELLTAAYAVHPAFAEARIVEFGTGLRPAFPDNLPRIRVDGARITVNGLYRHGFLLAPALAELTLAYVDSGRVDNEVMQCV